MNRKVMWDIIKTKDKVHLNCPVSNDIREVMDFGFAYMESIDHMVHYVVANGKVMKKILVHVNDSRVSPEGEAIGDLWTAKLMVSDKLNSDEIIFSNNTFSTVLNVNTNPI